MNASVEVGCDLRCIDSTNPPDFQGGNEEEKEDVDVSSLSQATVDMTTIGDLRRSEGEGEGEGELKDDEATYSVSCTDAKLTDISAIEARNRSFFDRVTLAVN